jgi:hypothetical protein
MREELQSILDDFDYNRGLDWFKSHVPGKYFIKELLSSGEDPYNRSKLIEELRAALDLFGAVPIPQKEQRPSAPIPTIPKGISEYVPETMELAKLAAEWKPLYKEANHYFETIGYLQSAEERKEAAFKILDLMDDVSRIWEKKDFLEAHGQLPEFNYQGIEQLSPAQVATRINTLRTYISKANKGKLNKDSIPKWEAEKLELERRLSQ